MTDCNRAVTALGLHREADLAYSPMSSLSPSFMVAEFRRRLFCLCFDGDKQISTFMGRPPGLSKRYTTCHLPLDLSDAQMMAEGEELDKIKSRLDYNGWNRDGKCYPNTTCRASMMMALIRDEVLELSLGPPIEGHVMETRRESVFSQSKEEASNTITASSNAMQKRAMPKYQLRSDMSLDEQTIQMHLVSPLPFLSIRNICSTNFY